MATHINVYRIIKATRRPFDPTGSAKYGGRWNPKGIEAIYCSQSVASCHAELTVHLSSLDLLPDDLQLWGLQIPIEHIKSINTSSLPDGWHKEKKDYSATQPLGAEMLSDENNLAILVPSAVFPRDMNIVLNPAHPLFKELVKTAERIDYEVDERIPYQR